VETSGKKALSVMSSMNAIGRSTVSGRPRARMYAATVSLEFHDAIPVSVAPVPAEPYTMCWTPVALAASATFLPRTISASVPPGMKFCTLYTPYASRNACISSLPFIMSARTTSAPRAASARAAGPSGPRVTTRTRQSSDSKCRATAPPWRPVAPVTTTTPTRLTIGPPN
jgi:hypothetical protein